MEFYAVSGPHPPEKSASGRGAQGCNSTDGTAALQKPWDFLSRATGILRSWEELDRIALSGRG